MIQVFKNLFTCIPKISTVNKSLKNNFSRFLLDGATSQCMCIKYYIVKNFIF